MIILVLFTTIPVIIMTITNVTVSSQSIIESREENIIAQTYGTGKALDAFIEKREHEVELMASSPTVTEFCQDPADQTKYNAAASALQTWVNGLQAYANFVVTDSGGKVILSGNAGDIGKDISSEEYIKTAAASGATAVAAGNGFVLSPGVENIAMSHCVTDSDGECRGVITLFLNENYFDRIVGNISVGQTGTAFLTDANNFILFHQTSDMANQIVSFGTEKRAPLADSSKWGTHTNDFLFKDAAGDWVFNSSYTLLDVGWILYAQQPYAEIEAATHHVGWVALIGLFAALAASVLAGLFIIGKIVKPLNKLKEVFSTAASDSKYIRCDIETKNEFGELARDYNIMIERLDSNYERLQEAYDYIEQAQVELQTSYDVLVRHDAENEYLAYTDFVTGMPNKLAFDKKLDKILSGGDLKGALVHIDMDNLRSINEVLGYEMGNELLKKVAAIISKSEISDIGIVARVSGDEFYVVVFGSQRDVDYYCKEKMKALEQPIQLGNQRVRTSVTMGVTLFPSDGVDAHMLIKNSDNALIKAKALGTGRFCYFDENLRKQVSRYEQVLTALHDCVTSKELFLVYQPEVDFKTGKILALESLMRLKSRELGYIAPREFLPIAESNGLVVTLCYWALEESCRFVKKLIDSCAYDGLLAVNIAPSQLVEHDFEEKIMETLRKTEFPPERLQVEVTEGMLAVNLKTNADKLNALKSHGINIALDDFGTLYSSLNYLSSLPFDTIKVDTAFVGEICTNARKQIIMDSIVGMSHGLHMKVVGEGVEYLEQRLFLQEHDCDIMQGYLFSAPVDENGIVELLGKEGKNDN